MARTDPNQRGQRAGRRRSPLDDSAHGRTREAPEQARAQLRLDRADARLVSLGRFLRFAGREFGIEALTDLRAEHLAAFARHLGQQVAAGACKPRQVRLIVEGLNELLADLRPDGALPFAWAAVWDVECPYCGAQARLADSAEVYGHSSYGPVFVCQNFPHCDAYVGVHADILMPLGRLADSTLRVWKRRAHRALDALWQGGAMSRGEAYRLLQTLLGLPPEQAHIGLFDEAQCRALIERLRTYRAGQRLAEAKPAAVSRHRPIRSAVTRHLAALGCAEYDLVLQDTRTGQLERYCRSAADLLDRVVWWALRNAQGAVVCTRPAPASQGLILVDYLTAPAVERLVQEGYPPALVMEVAPECWQAWVRIAAGPVPDPLAVLIEQDLARRSAAVRCAGRGAASGGWPGWPIHAWRPSPRSMLRRQGWAFAPTATVF